MRKFQKIANAMVLASMIMTSISFPAWADTDRAVITSVSLEVKLDMGEGQELPDDPEGNIESRSSKYTVTGAEWETDIRDVQIGDTPRIKVWLTPEYVGEKEYYFRGSYSSSNVSIRGGTFVSARRDGDDLAVVLKTKPIEGQYDPPLDAYWRESGWGYARWEAPDVGSGYYDVSLYRGSSLVKKLEAYKGTSYNFYPYMTKAGTYSFKVRTVPSVSSSAKSGSKSDWIESDEMYLSREEVSDGSGQTNDNGGSSGSNVGWIPNGGSWYYKYPDGTYVKNDWCQIGGVWYYFNGSGIMETGWQKLNGTWYYLADNGAMVTGWKQLDGTWYYFNGSGAMVTGWQVINNRWYYFNGSGSMVTGWQNINGQTYFFNNSGEMQTGWIASGGNWYYLNQNAGGQQGQMCKNVWIKMNGNTYYVDEKGVMAEGWQEVAGSWYYFYPGDGRKAVNTVIDGFQVDGNGVWHK